MCVGIVWLIGAQYGLLDFTPMDAAWWAAHALEVVGVGMVGLPVASVPTEVLNKPAPLTDEEFAEIRRHPSAGRELLAELGGFSTLVLDLVESHHERLDSAGYPNRISANELALEVRILTVADVYEP